MDFYEKRFAIRTMLMDMNFGREMIAYVGVLNGAKELSTEQIAQIAQMYAPIMNLLMAGALRTARSLIEQIVPDGIIVTDEDKALLLADLNDYIGA